MIYAVIDTNVFVSALFSKNINVATVKVLDAIFQGKIVPLYNDEITVPIRNHNVKNPPINDTSIFYPLHIPQIHILDSFLFCDALG